MLEKIWKQTLDIQERFFGKLPQDVQGRAQMTKEYTIHLMTEIVELLNAVPWKMHRKQDKIVNREEVREELADIFAYYVSLCNVWDIKPEQAVDDYWRKMMVVVQRHSEEYLMNEIKGPILLCDIDGVLCSYAAELVEWVLRKYRGAMFLDRKVIEKCEEIFQLKEPASVYLNAETFGISDEDFQRILHDFRTTRGKVGLPVYPYAKKLLDAYKHQGFTIVLLTSRPIDKYPNVYTDTLEWLKKNDLKFDHLWWASDKAKKIVEKGLAERIEVFIDDDFNYASKLAKHCRNVVWVNRLGLYKPALAPNNLTEMNGGAMETWVCQLEHMQRRTT